MLFRRVSSLIARQSKASHLAINFSMSRRTTTMTCHNDGEEPISVPGFGLPIDWTKGWNDEDKFAHGASSWQQNPRLTVRELAMLKVMEALTDKPEWTRKVFDDTIVAKWREEALQMPLISEKAWDWCLLELRDKARFYEEKGYVLTLDTGSVCAKSDTIVDETLRTELLQAVQPLLDSPAKDWHPNSGNQVLNLVHPSLFPLVYGKSRVLKTGIVGLDNFMDSYGKGEVVPGDQEVDDNVKGFHSRSQINNSGRWSNKFQWLPCEVTFKGDQGTDVQITSYINNLHPLPNKPLYGVIEKLISLAILAWNDILIKGSYGGDGRMPPRIQTFGSSFENQYPEWANDLKEEPEAEGYQESLARVKEYLAIPDRPDAEDIDSDDDEIEYQDGTWVESDNPSMWGAVDWKWKRIRRIAHPEPSVAYSYEDWKKGETHGAVVTTGYGRGRPHIYYDVKLQDTFREKGLQVIVKLASIELTPDKPDYEGGSWHIEGMLNEHIVGTAIYYYDVENTTTARIRFRQEANLDSMEMGYEQDDHGPLSEIFGCDSLRNEPAVQELGSVATPQGRLIAFPNTLQHCVEPFTLEDKKRPGHRRFLVLWLVDPYYRVMSTRNVPPQRHDWWLEAGLKQVEEEVFGRLPVELAAEVGEMIGEWPIGMAEAKDLRLELMEERTKLMDAVDKNMDEYNFCEH
ncbi:hypothetical protein BU16DRAFT_389520 [Lophium mytilinum]|uniref:Uncharacterized protein n=1 Tax=Lophium mytilinum TaxID=390894 RepID=A0A6A6QTE7_9PEZI|nr:hypothetical protein BU16DRAFT_389520 [Lophium mytilinum]